MAGRYRVTRSTMENSKAEIPGGLMSVATARALKRVWPSVFITLLDRWLQVLVAERKRTWSDGLE